MTASALRVGPATRGKEKAADRVRKFLIVGQTGVGKTSLVSHLHSDQKQSETRTAASISYTRANIEYVPELVVLAESEDEEEVGAAEVEERRRQEAAQQRLLFERRKVAQGLSVAMPTSTRNSVGTGAATDGGIASSAGSPRALPSEPGDPVEEPPEEEDDDGNTPRPSYVKHAESHVRHQHQQNHPQAQAHVAPMTKANLAAKNKASAAKGKGGGPGSPSPSSSSSSSSQATVSVVVNTMRVEVYDSQGSEAAKPLVRKLYSEVDAVLLVYSLADRGSFEAVTRVWEAEMRRSSCTDDIVVVLVGTQSDRVAEDEGRELVAEAEDLASSRGWLSFEATSFLRDSARAPFLAAAREIDRREQLQVAQAAAAEKAEARKARRAYLRDPLTVRARAGVERRAAERVPALATQALQDAHALEPCLVVGVAVDRYEGGRDPETGAFSGHGKAWFKNGVTVDGIFERGLPHGLGYVKWEGGPAYEGELRAGEVTGEGVMTWPNGDEYSGGFDRGWRHGLGTFAFAAPRFEHYTGSWHYGRKHGHGMIIFNHAATEVYDGDWVENERTGFGTMTYASGNVYRGQWLRGKRHGKGEMIWRDGGREERYTGDWVDGQAHGRGEHVWLTRARDPVTYPLLNRYIGEFSNGERHGRGVFYYADGGRYEGGMAHNTKHGWGVMRFADGTRYEGPFDKDRMVGDPEREQEPAPGQSKAGAKEGYERPATLPMVLDIKDLLVQSGGGSNDAEVLASVERALLRHVSDLRGAYGRYAAAALEADESLTALSLAELVRLLQALQVPTRAVNLVQLCEALRRDTIPTYTELVAERDLGLASAIPNGGGGGGASQGELVGAANYRAIADGLGKHNPSLTFLLRHFVENMVRLADVRYAAQPPPAPPAGLADKVKAFCDSHLSLLAQAQPSSHRAFSEITAEALLDYRPALLSTYNTLRGPKVPHDPNSAGLPTARAVIEWLKGKGALGTESLTPLTVLHLVIDRYGNPDGRDTPREPFDALIDELAYSEFEDILVGCAEQRFQGEEEATRIFLEELKIAST